MIAEDEKANALAVNEINALTIMIADHLASMGLHSSPRLCFVLMSLAEANCEACGIDSKEVLRDVLSAEIERKSVRSSLTH